MWPLLQLLFTDELPVALDNASLYFLAIFEFFFDGVRFVHTSMHHSYICGERSISGCFWKQVKQRWLIGEFCGRNIGNICWKKNVIVEEQKLYVLS